MVLIDKQSKVIYAGGINNSYLPQAFDLKISGANKETIAAALFKIETETMCLSGNMEHCREITGKIVDL